MFQGDEIRVESFVVRRQLPAKRVRLVADVNGVTCFVKTFGDRRVQCAADELKRLVGLTPLGVSRATVPTYGDVLVARYFPNHTRFNDLQPTEGLARQLLPILWFDVWIRNNDRTGTNVLLVDLGHDDKMVVPIDESAAFKGQSTFRMTKKRPWYDAVASVWHGWTMPNWPPDQAAVADTLRRTWPQALGSVAEQLLVQAQQMDRLWWQFKRESQRRVYGVVRPSGDI